MPSSEDLANRGEAPDGSHAPLVSGITEAEIVECTAHTMDELAERTLAGDRTVVF